MAPPQALMDMDPLNPPSKPHSPTQVAAEMETKNLLENSDGKGLRCISTCEDAVDRTEALLHEQTKAPTCHDDVELDIIECTNIGNVKLAEVGDPDATEYSSSFGDTVSGTENCSVLSEAEVESQFLGHTGLASAFDEFGGMFQMRKKKLTNHWRSFISPLRWRCKWTELRIKEIESQASRYASELAAFRQRKHSSLDQFPLEDFGSKSLSFSSQYCKKKALKRRKRKRIEDTTNISSYISHHNIFSYFEKKSDLDGTSMADDFCNIAADQNAHDEFVTNNESLLFEFREDDNCLEQVLWKIEIVHSRVHKLKIQIDKLMSKNAAKFSSSENSSLLVPCDEQTSSAPSPTFSPGNGDAISAGAIYPPTQHISEFDIGDLVMPESAISSYGEAFHVPDIIESTVGLLSATDVTLHQPQFGDSCEDIVDNVLIHNEASEAEEDTLKTTGEQSTEHQVLEKGEQEESTNAPPIPTSGPDAMEKSVVPQEQQSTLKSCLASDVHVPRNKRKRGERKGGGGGGGSSGWNKKCSGEADSQ